MSDWTPRGTPQVNFRAGGLLPALEARTDTGSSIARTASRDLDRYYTLLAREVPTFTEGEGSLIVDALNGTLTEPHTASLLWANIADALEDGLAEKWHVDGAALVERLRKLTPFQSLAVADAAERFWISATLDGAMTHAERLRKVGLVR